MSIDWTIWCIGKDRFGVKKTQKHFCENNAHWRIWRTVTDLMTRIHLAKKKLNMPSGNQFNSTSLQQLLIRKTQNTRFCLSASYSPKISLFTPVPFSKFYFSLSYSTFDCISPRKWYNNAACHILDKNINLLVSKKRHTGFQNTFRETSSVIQQSMWRNKANKKHMTIWSPTYQRSCLTS